MTKPDRWTAAARQQHNNAVVVAIPASSHPWTDAGEAGLPIEAVDEGLASAAFAAVIFAASTARSGIRRLQNRRKPVGQRDVNERVALLFYQDRVDVHERSMGRTTVGRLLESHPISDIERPDHNQLIIGDTRWTLSGAHSGHLTTEIGRAGLELSTGNETS